MSGWFDQADAFLLGQRRTNLRDPLAAGHRPRRPIAAKLNTLPKYVASTTLDAAGMQNSSLLAGRGPEVAKLKERPGRELQVHGSGQLAQTLIDHDLVDEYRLLTSPSISARGRSCSATAPGRPPCGSCRPRHTSTGVIIAATRPTGRPVRFVRPRSGVTADLQAAASLGSGAS